MDNRRSSGRFSLNGSQFTNPPIAESTQIHGNSFMGSPRHNSGNCSFSSNTPPARVQKTIMSPASKLDPRIYADVMSRGLASRIVQYHDNTSRRMNKSLTGSEAYNKPGQFPIVHLNTKEKAYKPPKNVSIVRIPPPERSLYQGNTLSGLLRSGSIVPSVNQQKPNTHTTSKYLNGTVHENQPILHPPVEINADLQPTRSALEDLKAISRKRINSDDSDREISKKLKDVDDESAAVVVATPVCTSLSDPLNQSVKRQREGQSPQDDGVTDVSPSEKQAVKKRLYTQNNEISSSLSSSLNLIKRKNLQQQFTLEENSKKCKQQDDDHIELPKLPEGDTWSIPDETDSPKEDLSTEPKEQLMESKPKPKITLFNKNYDECEIRRIPFHDENSGKIPFIKPKKKSEFASKNEKSKEKAQQMKLELMLKGLKGELGQDSDDIDGPVVEAVSSTTTPSVHTAPVSFGDIKSSSSSTVSSSILSVTASVPTLKSSASSTVSSSTLSVNAPIPTLKIPEVKENTPSVITTTPAFSFGGATTTTTSNPESATTKTTVAPISFGPSTTSTIAPISFKPSTTSTISPISFGPSTTSTIAPISFKPSTTSTIAPISFGPSTNSTIAPISFGPSTNNTIAPISFGTSSAAATTTTTTNTFGAATTTVSSIFGAISTSTAATTTSSSVSAFTLPSKTPTFGSSTTSSSVFGSSSTNPPAFNSAPTSATSFSSTAASLPVFGSSTVKPPTFGSSAVNPPTFGGSAANPPTFGGSAAKPPAFGNSTSNPPAFGNSTSNPPAFGSSTTTASTFGSSTTTASTFGSSTFGTTKASDPGMFGATFGSSTPFGSSVSAPAATAATTTTTNNNSLFGNTTAKPTTQSGFNFGNTSSASPPAFGSPSTNKPPPSTPGGFNFSSTTANGNSSKPAVFGESAQDNKAPLPAPSSGGFSFGGNNQAQGSSFSAQSTNKPFSFAGSTEAASPKPGGFSFGGAASSTTQASSPSPFSNNITSAGSNFVFGKTSTEMNKTTATVSPFGSGGGSSMSGQQASGFGGTFGGQAPQSSSTFSFGGLSGSTPASNNPQTGFGQTTSNIFGSAATSASSGFGTNNTGPSSATNSAFGKSSQVFNNAPNNNSNSNYVFGGGANTTLSSNNPGQSASQAFGFGGSSQPQQPNNAAPSAFQFGSTAPNNTNSSFNFSSSAATNAPAFGVTPANAFAPNPTNNLFNPGPSDRPIRKATRRMQK